MADVRYFTGIDIGTTAVRCVIGRMDQGDDVPTIIGSGQSVNLGMRKGAIVNIPHVIAAVDAAVDAAEKTAGYKVDKAVLNVNGVHIVGINSKGVIAIKTPTKEINEEELLRVEEAATVVQLPANREIVQVFARGYRLDGQDNIRDPLGMTGVRLEVDAHVVTAATTAMRNLQRVAEGVDIIPADKLLSSIAATNTVLGREQREQGVVLVDIGGGTTNVAVVEEGDLQHVAVLPVGGINLTNDLAIGLRTDLDVAEQLKLQYGDVGSSAKSTRTIKVKFNRGEYSFPKDDIDMIIRARLDEVFELVDRELAKINRSGRLPGGAVLVGGTANLAGIADYAKASLRLPARVSHPSGFSGIVDKINKPEYTTAIGLMLHHFSLGMAPAVTGDGTGFGISLPTDGAMKALKSVGSILKKLKP